MSESTADRVLGPGSKGGIDATLAHTEGLLVQGRLPDAAAYLMKALEVRGGRGGGQRGEERVQAVC